MTEQNTTDQHFWNSLRFGYPAASSALCCFGSLANAASLVYFIRKPKKSIGDKMLMLLNTIDLLLCIFATTISIFISSLMNSDQQSVYNVLFCLMILYAGFVDGTAYATCLLSATRGISIVYPFYRINGKMLVAAGIIVFIVMELSGPAVTIIIPLFLAQENYNMESLLPMIGDCLLARIVTTSLMMLVVLLGTVVAVYKLTSEDIQPEAGVSRNNVKATWTVVILSALYFLFNSIVLGIMVFIERVATNPTVTDSGAWELDPNLILIAFFGFFVAIPLNSVINPIVYFVRRNDMRQFFKQYVRHLLGWFQQ